LLFSLLIQCYYGSLSRHPNDPNAYSTQEGHTEKTGKINENLPVIFFLVEIFLKWVGGTVWWT
jgi:hypothetical protein